MLLCLYLCPKSFLPMSNYTRHDKDIGDQVTQHDTGSDDRNPIGFFVVW